MSDDRRLLSQFVSTTIPAQDVATDILLVPVFHGERQFADFGDLDGVVGGEWTRALASREFSHRTYECLFVRVVNPGWKAARLCLVGAGERADLDAERLRRLAAAGSHAARQRGAASIAWLMREGMDVEAASVVADGLSAAEFDSGSYKSGDRPASFPATVTIVATGARDATLASAVHRGRVIGESVNFTRALANEPGNVLTPREFATRVSSEASGVGLGVDVIDETRLRDLGMRLLLSVAQGSAEPPRLMVIRHEPADAPASPVLALVGKGVTFDSGGISIKPADGMERMKDDMAGGAAVAGALRALALLKAPVRVIGIIPTVENMPGGRATRPGDVVIGASGTSVEIINTDAEGRLILADALWYAQQLGATHMIDVATLTGACLVALGRTVSGLFGKPVPWVEAVRAAAARAGDRVWHMPIYEEAKEQLRSEIADLTNTGGRPGGACTAAAFLREFSGDRPWAHLDIAGTAWAETRHPYQPKGATGVAVRTLIELGMTGGRLQSQ